MRYAKAALVLLPKVVVIAIRIKENRSLHKDTPKFKLRLLNHTFLHIAITNTEQIGLSEIFQSGLLVYQLNNAVGFHVESNGNLVIHPVPCVDQRTLILGIQMLAFL